MVDVRVLTGIEREREGVIMKKWIKFAAVFAVVVGILAAVDAPAKVFYFLGVGSVLWLPLFVRDAFVSTREFIIRLFHLEDNEVGGETDDEK